MRVASRRARSGHKDVQAGLHLPAQAAEGVEMAGDHGHSSGRGEAIPRGCKQIGWQAVVGPVATLQVLHVLLYYMCKRAMCCICRKIGRAMLRPIYDQKTRRDGRLSSELRRALTWWIQILKSNLCERRSWTNSRSEPVHLFCDASGSPAHLGAVLLIDNKCYFTHYVPPAAVVNGFRRRSDNQIMGLELLSISLGLCTFADLIRGRNVVVHSDNTGAEV